MIIFNNTSAEMRTKSADVLVENDHNFDKTEDCIKNEQTLRILCIALIVILAHRKT